MSSSREPPEESLAHLLELLNLRGITEDLDDFLARATKKRFGPVQVLEEMARIEHLDRKRRSLESRVKRSRIGAFKPMSKFDWNWPQEIDRDLVERLLKLSFLEDKANVLFVSAHGLGKTMLLKNISHRAVHEGHAVLFTTAARMLTDLSGQESMRALERRLKHYAGFSILTIDELGYLSYDNRAADLLFEVVTRRHDAQKPILLSTNLAFSNWTTVFPNATSTVALVDRLTHRADIIKITGESWRVKESKERQNSRRKPKE